MTSNKIEDTKDLNTLMSSRASSDVSYAVMSGATTASNVVSSSSGSSSSQKKTKSFTKVGPELYDEDFKDFRGNLSREYLFEALTKKFESYGKKPFAIKWEDFSTDKYWEMKDLALARKQAKASTSTKVVEKDEDFQESKPTKTGKREYRFNYLRALRDCWRLLTTEMQSAMEKLYPGLGQHMEYMDHTGPSTRITPASRGNSAIRGKKTRGTTSTRGSTRSSYKN